MENLLLNGLPVPLADIKDMDDCIIQEMNFKLSNEEIVNQWDTKIRRKIASKLSVCKNEKVFEDVLKDYLRLLKEQAKNFKEKKVLKEKITCHLKVFHLLCYSTREQVGLYMVNYLDYIENILIVLCNLELEVIRQLKKNHVGKEYNKTVKRVARRLIDSLSVNLLNEEKRICHVLLKLDSKHEQSWKDVMHIVYNHYMINLPVRDRSDLSFCRYYLLFQKWKSITDKNKHQVMDKIMYLKFDKTADSISGSPLLKSILLPPTESLVDLVDVLTNGQQVTVNAYFKYIEGRYEEDEIRVPQAIELDSDEDEESTQKLLFEPSESEKRRNGLIKSEKHNKIPVQENARYLEISSNDGQVVCVIDDDSDIEEVCVQDTKSNRRRKLGLKSASSRPVVSFLDSICLPDEFSKSPTHTSSSIEKEGLTAPPAENTILPIVTAYIDSVRRKGALTDTDTQETSKGIESLSIRADVQMEVACVKDVLNAVSCTENVESSLHCTRTTNKNIPGDSSHNKNNNSDSAVREMCVQSVVSSQSSDNVILMETQNTNDSEKCTCCCKHTININNKSSSNNTQSKTDNSNKSVTKPNLKTVEIQTENMDSFNYLCGMITPPSDRTADENSPSSMENICSETEIHNNNSGNTNVYAYVPSITATRPYMENTSHNHYESDVETHSDNYSGVCESATQVYNFDRPGDTHNHNESLSEESSRENTQEQNSKTHEGLLEESAVQSSTENVQDQSSNMKESRENLIPAQIEQSNQEEETTDEPINETELSEEPLANEIHLIEIENVAEPEQHENQINEIELEEQTSKNDLSETQIEQQEQGFEEEPEEQVNQTEFDETEPDNDFNDTCMDDSEEVELELDNTHIDDTHLVSEIELHEEVLTEVLPEVGVSENETSILNEQNQDRSELEHYKDTAETNSEEGNHSHSIINTEEYQINSSIVENCVSNEPESIVSNISNDSSYSDLSNVPIIIAESQNIDLQESAIDIIPFDLINTVILGDSFVPDKEIVLVPNIDRDDGESTKFTVYKIGAEVSEKNVVNNSGSHQVYNGKKSVSMEQDKVLTEKESSIIKDTTAVANEVQSCKIQASVTMAQLVNKTSSKTPKNGEHVKTVKKKNVEENVDKIIFTSNERVKSAPLSLFAKFEQSQSDLVDNAFSGPIEPITSKTSVNCDCNSNSNDSFCLFDSDRSVITKDFRDNNSPSVTPEEGGSPISPPYENIHAQEYESHVLNINLETLSKEETSTTQKKLPTTTVELVEETKVNSVAGAINELNSEIQNNFQMPATTSIISNKGIFKRKHSDARPVSKKLKVNFGHTEIKFIPMNTNKPTKERISKDTMAEYNIRFDDLKLLHSEPAVVVKLDSQEDLKRRLHKLYVNSILNNLLFEKRAKSENSCIMTRVDYKKPFEEKTGSGESPFSPSFSHSAGSSVPSAISKRVEAPRTSGISPPSGYIPALNSTKSGLKRASDYSQDKEEKYNSDSRTRTRRKRTLTPKAQKQQLLRPSPEPSTSKVQKRPRGRPKKTVTTKSPNNGNVGVLYSDGPFRLG